MAHNCTREKRHIASSRTVTCKLMKYCVNIIIFIILFSCDNKSNSTINQKHLSSSAISQDTMDDGWNYKEVKKNNIDSLMKDPCQTSDFECIDFYPLLDSIASDPNEKEMIVDMLKSKGFKVINSGRGNWQDGPRIVSRTLSNGKCNCQVDKLYYSKGEKSKYKVTERIKCRNASR